MHRILRILAGLVCLGAGLFMLAFAEQAAAWAPDPSAAGVVLCLAAGFFLAGPLLRRRAIKGDDFRVRPPRDSRK
jgi:drug/metabolite transporter (DMT)-like permease